MAWRGWAVALLAVLAAARAQESCRSVERDPYLLFGTKTAYIFSNKGVPNLKAHEVVGCQPIALWHLTRHGAHNPAATELPALRRLVELQKNILANLKGGNHWNTDQRMCSADVAALGAWRGGAQLDAAFAGELASDGYLTTQQLAQAFRRRFPGLLTADRRDYMFKFEADKVSSSAFRAYTEGLFRAQAEIQDIAKDNDEKLLKPYKYCPAWTREVEENNETLTQRHIFESKQEYKQMITNISLRLGFNYDVDHASLLAMYDMCRYDKAWSVQNLSPWCVAFTQEDLKRLEYAEDLELFYKYGYGAPHASQLGCTLLKDMMEFFSRHINAERAVQPRVTVHVTDHEMFLLALAALGARRDAAPLTGDNYRAGRARRWAASLASPYNANLAVALYKCSPNGKFQVADQYQALLLENEVPLAMEGCRVGLCPFSLLQARLRDTVEHCDLAFCSAAAPRAQGPALLLLGLLLNISRFKCLNYCL